MKGKRIKSKEWKRMITLEKGLLKVKIPEYQKIDGISKMHMRALAIMARTNPKLPLCLPLAKKERERLRYKDYAQRNWHKRSLEVVLLSSTCIWARSSDPKLFELRKKLKRCRTRWAVDSACTAHMTGKKGLLKNLKKCASPVTVKTATGGQDRSTLSR